MNAVTHHQGNNHHHQGNNHHQGQWEGDRGQWEGDRGQWEGHHLHKTNVTNGRQPLKIPGLVGPLVHEERYISGTNVNVNRVGSHIVWKKGSGLMTVSGASPWANGTCA